MPHNPDSPYLDPGHPADYQVDADPRWWCAQCRLWWESDELEWGRCVDCTGPVACEDDVPDPGPGDDDD